MTLSAMSPRGSGKRPVELKGLQQNGEVEPRGSAALAEQIVLIRGQQPMPGQLLRVPILLHAYKDGARSGCSQRSIPRTCRPLLRHAALLAVNGGQTWPTFRPSLG